MDASLKKSLPQQGHAAQTKRLDDPAGPFEKVAPVELSDHAKFLSKLREAPAIREDVVQTIRTELDTNGEAFEDVRLDHAIVELLNDLCDGFGPTGSSPHVEDLTAADVSCSNSKMIRHTSGGIADQFSIWAAKSEHVAKILDYADSKAGEDRRADFEFVATVVRDIRRDPPTDIEERKLIAKTLNGKLLRPHRIRIQKGEHKCTLKIGTNGNFLLNKTDPSTGKSGSEGFMRAELSIAPWLGKYSDENDDNVSPAPV